MNDRQKKVVYKAMSFVFAILFFSLLFANVIYNWQKSDLDKGMIELSNQATEAKLFASFFENFEDRNNCQLMENELHGFAEQVYNMGRIVNMYYEKNENIEEIKDLQKQHTYLNLELWLKIVQFNKLCPDHRKDYILYFYPYNCKECAPLATKILELEKERKDLWIFSIPAQIDVKMVNLLQLYFDVNYLPSVVVNGYTIRGPDAYKDIENYLSDNNENI